MYFGTLKPHEFPSADRGYEGGAFAPALPGGRASGVLRIDWTGIRFASAKGGLELPLDGLKLQLGGASDRLIFLSHPSQPEVVVHTADHALLDHPVIGQTPALSAQVAQVRRKKRITTAVLLSIATLLVAAVLALVLARGTLAGLAARAVPVDWEIKAGQALFEQMTASKRFIRDAAFEADLEGLTTPLGQGIQDRKYPLTFHIVEDPALNAFALPGGHVILHSGLLLAAVSPEEVAGVLAHEIAHVTRRHSIRKIISSGGLYLVLSTLAGDTTGLLAVLADNSAFLLDRSFSRDFEREADDVGWDYLLRADIEPRGMITFFQKMQQEEKRRSENAPLAGAEKALALASTHPATEERITRLESKWSRVAKSSGYRNMPLKYDEFKARLRAQLHSAEKSSAPE